MNSKDELGDLWLVVREGFRKPGETGSLWRHAVKAVPPGPLPICYGAYFLARRAF
jgi:hypothetical protein